MPAKSVNGFNITVGLKIPAAAAGAGADAIVSGDNEGWAGT